MFHCSTIIKIELSIKKLFTIQSFQAAFFVSNIDLSDRLAVANTIKNALSPILDGIPTIPPFTDDIPLEIPRITLTNKSGNVICNIAGNRIDLIYEETNSKNTPINTIKSFFSILEPLSITISKKISNVSNRLALVTNYKTHSSIDGLKLLKSKYLSDEKDASIELQIHKLSKEKILQFQVNNWLRLIAKNGGKKKEGQFLIISDINTLKDAKYKIALPNIMRYFEEAFSLSQKTALDVIKK